MQFPGARGTFGGKIRLPQKFLPEIAQLFYILRFGRPDPQGREITKYGFSGPFWPRAAPWHLEKFRAKNRKKIRPPHKFIPKSAQQFYILCFGRTDPQGREIAKYGGFRHFWPRAALGT